MEAIKECMNVNLEHDAEGVIDMERSIEQGCALMVQTAKGLTIASHEDYARGTEILKDIKSRVKAVKEYWKGPKEAANAAHKELVAREAQMLKPLTEAEGIIKKAMLAYDTEVKRKRQEAEEAARKAREAEAERLAALAAKAAQDGDEDTADVLLDMAEEVPMQAVAVEAAPVAKGVSVRKTWKARVTDPKLVPAYWDGMELRSINMTALNNIAKWRNGEAKIPGVEFYQEASMSVRA